MKETLKGKGEKATREKTLLNLTTQHFDINELNSLSVETIKCSFFVVVNPQSTLDCIIFSDFFCLSLVFVLRTEWKREAARKGGGKATINFLCAVHSPTVFFCSLQL